MPRCVYWQKGRQLLPEACAVLTCRGAEGTGRHDALAWHTQASTARLPDVAARLSMPPAHRRWSCATVCCLGMKPGKNRWPCAAYLHACWLRRPCAACMRRDATIAVVTSAIVAGAQLAVCKASTVPGARVQHAWGRGRWRGAGTSRAMAKRANRCIVNDAPRSMSELMAKRGRLMFDPQAFAFLSARRKQLQGQACT